MNHGYAASLQRQALVAEADRLLLLQGDTETVRRNLSNILNNRPVRDMDDDGLRAFVDLLARSICADVKNALKDVR